MLFLAGAGVSLWFLGSLRAHLLRAEKDTGRLSSVAFGAGSAWVALNMLAQAFQIGVADAAPGEHPPRLTTMHAVFTVANLPLAVMLGAVAVVSLRHPGHGEASRPAGPAVTPVGPQPLTPQDLRP